MTQEEFDRMLDAYHEQYAFTFEADLPDGEAAFWQLLKAAIALYDEGK